MYLIESFDGQRVACDSMRAVAKELGVSTPTVSYALKRKTLCKGRRIREVDRYFVVRLGRSLLVCKKSADGKSWIRCDDIQQQFPVGREVSAIDISKSLWND